MSKALYEKMIKEALAAQKADIEVIKEKRGQKFSLSDAQPYVDAVNGMTVGEDQCPAVIDLHVQSVNAHYEILKGLTDYVRPEDDPFVEHYQTPAILEILYEADLASKLDTSLQPLPIMAQWEAIRRYGGFYGPTCVVDFAFCPGSVPAVVNEILKKIDIPGAHKKAILSSKSWGMNTSYGIGGAFTESLEAGKTAAEAVQDEIEMLQLVYAEPIAAQTKLMTDGGHESFDVKEYMLKYKD